MINQLIFTKIKEKIVTNREKNETKNFMFCCDIVFYGECICNGFRFAEGPHIEQRKIRSVNVGGSIKFGKSFKRGTSKSDRESLATNS